MISGPAAADSIRHLTGRDTPSPRMAALRRISHKGERIDDALVLWFPGPRSETGEDMAEFHLHGGRAICAAALAALADLASLRPAGPGDFTRQAFDNGRLDLTQAEAVADLVNAETDAQRRMPYPRESTGRRAALAQWVADRKNPLTARVAVNHIWTRHFGLMETSLQR